MLSPFSWAFDLIKNTHLTAVQLGTPNAFKASNYGNSSIFIKSGEWLPLRDRYTPYWFDAKADFITVISKDDALIWGLSTGQQAKNMIVQPSLKLGWLHSFQISKGASLTLVGTYIFGGKIIEKPCYADYGFGKEEPVNCRLADKPMAPKETLNYLVNEKPVNYVTFNIRYKYVF